MTQNQNESFHFMIYDCVSNSANVSFLQLQLGIHDALGNFNNSKKGKILIFDNLNLIIDKYCLKCYQKLSEKRLFTSQYNNVEITRKGRKIRCAKIKPKENENIDKEGEFYKAGAF